MKFRIMTAAFVNTQALVHNGVRVFPTVHEDMIPLLHAQDALLRPERLHTADYVPFPNHIDEYQRPHMRSCKALPIR